MPPPQPIVIKQTESFNPILTQLNKTIWRSEEMKLKDKSNSSTP